METLDGEGEVAGVVCPNEGFEEEGDGGETGGEDS